VKLAKEEAARIREEVILPTEKREFRRGENFAASLQKIRVERRRSGERLRGGPAQPSTCARCAREYDHRGTFRRGSAAGDRLQDRRGPHAVKSYRMDRGFTAEIREIPSKTEIAAVVGRVDDSLFNAVEDAGESAELAMRIAQIFGYDLDFYTDPRKGDTFRIVLEKKKYANGQTAGYGKILAAEYGNAGKKVSSAALSRSRRPARILFGRRQVAAESVSSIAAEIRCAGDVAFQQGAFPSDLKTYRPHMGTDYGAPVGTPVQTIGSGRVLFAGRKGGEGNLVQVAHSNGYETMYLHLSRMFVRPGEHIEIGKDDWIGRKHGTLYGPHLDFRILWKGQYKNFEKLGLPPSDPVSRKICRSLRLCGRSGFLC